MLRRVLALIGKELAAIWSDPRMRFVILIPPLIQVMLFAYAATYDVTGVALGVWNEDRGAQGAELLRRFADSVAFRPAAPIEGPGEAAAAIDSRRVVAVLHIPQDFSADLLSGRGAAAQFIVDARRSNTALVTLGYAGTIVEQFNQDLRPGQPTPVALAVRDWFNPTLESQWFILPGLVAVLSSMMAMLISALSLARERELGTFEQLLVTPLRPGEILLGKAVPAILVGMIDAHLVVAAALLWFRVPLLGDPLLLEAAILLALFAAVGIGLVISTMTRTQQQAMLGVFVVASPLIVCSGYAAPVENMPAIVELLGRADPIRWLLVVSRGLFLQDMPFRVVLDALWPLALIASVAFLVAGVVVRRSVQ